VAINVLKINIYLELIILVQLVKIAYLCSLFKVIWLFFDTVQFGKHIVKRDKMQDMYVEYSGILIFLATSAGTG
jgi:hypothetical protein